MEMSLCSIVIVADAENLVIVMLKVIVAITTVL